MADVDCSSLPPAKKRKLLSSVEKMLSGINDLFRECYSVYLLRILNCNGDEGASFSQAICSTEKFTDKFSFSSFFQSTLTEAVNNFTEYGTDGAERDSDLFQNLLKVLQKSSDIARRLQNMVNKKQDTVQLAHHLLIPLSLHEDYTMDHNSRNQINKCVCCSEEITGKFDDTSMGHDTLWHGSTDILIGGNKVPVVVSLDEGEEECCATSLFKTKSDTHFEQCKHQYISEAIVFGLLQLKTNEFNMDSLIPTIVISTTDVKIYFYDAHHDFLLESSSMKLFTDDTEELHYGTLVALWLAINYHVTCTGITKDVFNTGFKADFMRDFSEDVREQYRNNLHFRNCWKKPNLLSDKEKLSEYKFPGGFPKPLKKGYKCFTSKHYNLIHARSMNIWD